MTLVAAFWICRRKYSKLKKYGSSSFWIHSTPGLAWSWVVNVKHNREPKIKVKNRIRPSTWHSLIASCVKMNTDGVRKPHTGLACSVGIVRDNHGRWIFGYGHNIEKCSIEQAELWAIYSGLKLIWFEG
ncbi:hypothetical protein GOBAR_DD23298 [Gossypium barbadense]|nr:hypothetical protein GOBAR_DD23298 [Gossypium barbadense]